MVVDLKDKVVLVTGASRGVGARTATKLLSCGADVVVHYHADKGSAESVVSGFHPSRSCLIQADLSDLDQAVQLWTTACAWKGGLDVLINNAGILIPARLNAANDAWREAWLKTFNVNVLAVAALCREAIAHFKTRQGGAIVNLASRAAFQGNDVDYINYGTSKAAVVNLTRSIARGCAKDNIYAYAIAPGLIHTDLTKDYIASKGYEDLVKNEPLGTLTSVEDVANMAVFLASGLARHATGSTIDINGASYIR